MKLSTLNQLLQAHPDKQFRLVLPGEIAVPVSFHITEVGHVRKKFMDCGGKTHQTETCQLQAWVGNDTDHRLNAGKMARVLRASHSVLPEGEDLDVEIEYEGAVISQYPVSDYSITGDAVVLQLTSKHTDCLAKESCLPTLTMATGATACCGSSANGVACCS